MDGGNMVYMYRALVGKPFERLSHETLRLRMR